MNFAFAQTVWVAGKWTQSPRHAFHATALAAFLRHFAGIAVRIHAIAAKNVGYRNPRQDILSIVQRQLGADVHPQIEVIEMRFTENVLINWLPYASPRHTAIYQRKGDRQMKVIKVTIDGTTPLMLCAFTDAAAQAATDGTRTSANGERKTPMEEAESFLYKDENGVEMIPNPNLLRCIMDGGAFFKSGRSKITTQKSSLVPACTTIEEICIPIISKEGWTVDTRPVRIPATGGRILRHRPLFNDWRLTFHMELDQSVISEKLMRDIVDAAGQRIGLGAFRPACKGPYGKFKVILWEAKEAELEAVA